MKTTIDVSDELLARAKRRARKVGKPLRVLFEEGLRLVLDGASEPTAYVLPDRSVGHPQGPNPLESISWPELRDEIYGGR